MDLKEAKDKKRTAIQKIGELIVHPQCSNSDEPLDISNLPGIGICLSSAQGEFKLSLHIEKSVDRFIVKALKNELNISDSLLDVQLTGVASAWTVKSKHHRPLATGLSISHCKTDQPTSGTLGCFVRKRSQPNKLFILSCAHVLLPPADWEIKSNQTNYSYKIVQPAICDGGNIESHWIADVKEAAPLNFSTLDHYDYAQVEDPIDAAIALVRPFLNQKCLTSMCNLLNGKYRTIEEIYDIQSQANPSEFHVFKIGKSTKLTSGKIIGFAFQRHLNYDQYMYQGMPARCEYTNLIGIEGIGSKPFSQAGDSGALIFDEDGYAIALLIGGSKIGGSNNKGITYAVPIETILNRLDLELFE
jgi:hypothetical protein